MGREGVGYGTERFAGLTRRVKIASEEPDNSECWDGDKGKTMVVTGRVK